MASFLGELKRRNVFKVAVAYAIVGWLLIQIAATVLPIFATPDWVLPAVTFLIILGLPIALIFSWAFELTPAGLERTKAVPVTESITPQTGRRLNVAILGLMAVAIGFLIVDRFVVEEAPATALSSAGVSIDDSSIAVLPFDNRSAREDDQFFVDGIHDDLLTQLARIGSMKVISRTSVMGYRNSGKNLRTIGEELGVAMILEGGVQRAGDTIRINVQLIDAATDEHLWADTYTRMLTVENVFAIQSEISRAIATALEASLSPEDVERLASVPTQSTRAYDFYLRGNDYFNRPDDQTYMPLAVEMYGQAVAEDPNFAVAWAALSRAHSNMHWYAVDRTPQRLELSLQAAQRALAIDPDLPEAHLALGSYYDHGFRDYAQAQREFAIAERAIPGDPALVEATAYMLRRMGDWDNALASLQRLLDSDPRNPDMLGQVAITQMILRNYAAAAELFERNLEIAPDDARAYVASAELPMYRDGDVSAVRSIADSPVLPIGVMREYYGWLAAILERDYGTALDHASRLGTEPVNVQGVFAPAPLLRGIALKLTGRNDDAAPEFRAASVLTTAKLAESPDDPQLYLALASALVGLGEFDAAKAAARRALTIMPRSRDDLTGSGMQFDAIIWVFAPAGDVATTVAELDVYLSESGNWSLEGLIRFPTLDPVRDDPRFQALVERYRRR